MKMPTSTFSTVQSFSTQQRQTDDLHEDHIKDAWGSIIKDAASRFIDGVARGEAARSKRIEKQRDKSQAFREKTDIITENFTGLCEGSISVETFREIMIALGSSEEGVKELLQMAVASRERQGLNIGIAIDKGISDRQYKWVEGQVKAKAKPVSPTVTPEPAVPAEPARPRTRAECIKVRGNQEEKVVDNSKGKRRRKKAV